MLLRIGKYKSLWEESNPLPDILESEFTDDDGAPDLRLSVYQIEATDVVRVFVEHCASSGLGLPSTRTHVDLIGAPATLKQDPVTSVYVLVRTTHCELHFSEASVLTDFLEQVRRELETRAHRVTSADVKTFVRSQLALGEEPWVSLAARWKVQLVAK